MAANQPPRRPSWRDKVESTAAAPLSKGGRAWQTQKPVASLGKTRWSRRTRLVMASVFFLALTGALIWVATLLRPPRPASLVLLGASYDDNLALPHNLQGWQGLEDLAQLTNRPESNSWLAWLGSGAINLLHRDDRLTSTTDWTKGWDDFKEQTIIVFVSLHGGVDGKGPFLFLDDRTGRKRLRLEQLLDHLDAGKLHDKNKLLILDATQAQSNWPAGQLHNDFVRLLKDLHKRRTADGSDANLYILCASDTGQRSWASEDWQQTIFGHFVTEGLKGGADKNGDSRVSAGELYHYVHDQVKQWARDNRDALQEPVLLGDEKSAEAVELVKIETSYDEPSREDTRGASVNLGGLDAVWKHYEELRGRTPSPILYAPHIWRQYQDTLLRYEQVVRAGDPTKKAASLKESLSGLEGEIAKAGRLPLVSAGNAIPLAAGFGQEPSWPEAELRELHVDDLWKNLIAKEQSAETWKKIKAWADSRSEPEKRLFRVHLISQMLTDLLDRPVAKGDLKRAHDALNLLGDDGRLRPIETHYLAMLWRDLSSPDVAPETLRLALRTRALAERAALGIPALGDPGYQPLEGKQGSGEGGARRSSYSDAVFPWIRNKVDAADKERWLGENLLFASGTDYRNEAQTHFTAAKALYEAALVEASVLQAAYQTRDTILAELPYYSEWLVRQRVLGESDIQRTEQLVNSVEQLWNEIHDLTSDLARPKPEGLAVAFPPGKRDLAERTSGLLKRFQEIQESFSRTCRELDRDARLQRVWQKTEDALLAPFIPADQRLHLLRNSRSISARLNASQSKNEGTAPPGDPVAESLEAGRREGRVAVALLGQRRLTEPEYVKLLDLITRPSAGQAAAPLNEAGERLEGHYDRLREETAKAINTANSNPNVEEAAVQAALADRYARSLNGAAASLMKNDPFGPGEAHHRLDLYLWVYWQINRTVDDHWFAESIAPEAQPYYLAAAELFLQDARELAKVHDEPLNKQRLTALDKLKEERCKRTALTVRLRGKAPVFMTSERQNIAWDVKADPGLPPGDPVFWLDVQGQVKPPADAVASGRKPPPNGREGLLTYLLESPIRADQAEMSASRRPLEGTAALRGRFRGQILDNATNVRIQLVPDTVVHRYPESNTAGIAVRASEEVQQGVLSVVMDASASMGVDDGKPWSRDKKCKYHDATQALRAVLRKLPRGTKVNVWVLGGGYDRERRETPIHPLRDELIAWNPENPRQLENLIDEVEEVKPEGASPIADAMVRALKKDLLPGVGIKTLLVLTDGDDNESREKNNIPDFLQREFGGKSVFVNMVFFQVSDEEKAIADRQFGKLDEILPGRGRVWFEKKAKDLPSRLEEALIPKVRLLQNGRSVPGVPSQGYRVSFDEDKDLRWSGELRPSTYEALVYNSFRQDVGLTAGDRLLILLHRKQAQITYERALFANEANNRRKPQRKDGDWLAGVLQNGYFPTDGSLRLLLTLEDMANRQPPEGDLLKQSKPGFRWIELRARGGSFRTGLRWANDEYLPAPAWRINMTDWPLQEGNAPAAADLEVWWTRDPYPPSHGILDHAPGKQVEEVRVDDQTITVESAYVAERIITQAPNSRVKKPCLILRITHDSKKPIWARLVGHTGGEEHDFFREPGQYTAVFWGISEAKAKKFTVDLTSLEKFKQGARNHVRFDDLPPPAPGDQGPGRVVLEKSGD
ncbi:MAG: hypothetical protein ACJ8FY_29060 [Gemmataceae bacterium]